MQVLVALACDLELDTLPCCAETHKWAWFRRYCTASRVAIALDKRTSLPRAFLDEVSPLRLWGHLKFLNANDRKYFHKVNFISVISALICTTEYKGRAMRIFVKLLEYTHSSSGIKMQLYQKKKHLEITRKELF